MGAYEELADMFIAEFLLDAWSANIPMEQAVKLLKRRGLTVELDEVRAFYNDYEVKMARSEH